MSFVNRLLKKSEQLDSTQDGNAFALIRAIAIISAVLAVITIVTALILGQPWVFMLSAFLTITCAICLLSLSDNWDAPVSIKLLAILFSLELSLILANSIFTYGYAIPVIAVLLSLLFLS